MAEHLPNIQEALSSMHTTTKIYSSLWKEGTETHYHFQIIASAGLIRNKCHEVTPIPFHLTKNQEPLSSYSKYPIILTTGPSSGKWRKLNKGDE